ncbi:MAG: DUF1285 domain-containing protein [Bacteroidetes bacterium]|nr:DUF1285 domain-containing protein [Bacteroidota bacterium]
MVKDQNISREPDAPIDGPINAPADAIRKVRQSAPQEFDISIAADGSWYHEGGHIGRPALVRLFATVLRREEDGSYWLVTPVERGRITVEDAPFVIVSMSRDEGDFDATGPTAPTQRLRFVTNVGDEVILSAACPLRMDISARSTKRPISDSATGPDAGENLRPYVLIRDGLEARVDRPVFYELAKISVEGPQGVFGVWSEGTFFPLERGDL